MRQPCRAASCEGKRVYLTWTAANIVARRQRRDTTGAALVKPYRCRDCRRWHLGNDRRKQFG